MWSIIATSGIRQKQNKKNNLTMKKVMIPTEEKTGGDSRARQEPRPTTRQAEFLTARVDSIRRCEWQPRKHFDQAALEDLAASVKEHGIQSPPLVRPLPRFTLQEPDLTSHDWIIKDHAGKAMSHWSKKFEDVARKELAELNKHAYELVFGERRWRAAQLAKLETMPVLVRQLTDNQVRELQVVENLQRADISPLEEAQAMRDWMDKDGVTADQVAEKIGKSRSHVFARLKLLKLSEPVRKAVLEGKVSQSLGELIARVPGEAAQVKALEGIQNGNQFWSKTEQKSVTEPMSIRAARDFIEEKFMVPLKGAAFDRKIEYAGSKVCPGACESCQFRSGNMKEEFPDIGSPDVCTNPAGFKEKTRLHAESLVATAYAKGERVLQGKALKGLFREDAYMSGKYALHYQSAWVDLGAKPQQGNRTWEQLLGKHVPKDAVHVAFDPAGRRHELLSETMALEAGKAAGLKVRSETEVKAEQQQDRAKREERSEFRNRVARAALGLVRKKVEGLELKAFGKVLRFMCQDMGFDEVARVRGVAEPTLLDLVEKGTDSQVLALMLEESMAHNTVDWNGEYEPGFDKRLKEFGVDLGKVEKAEREALKKENELPKAGEEFEFSKAELEVVAEKHYSADRIIEGKINVPYQWRGRRWVNIGGCGSGAGGTEYVDMVLAVPRAEFKGISKSYEQKTTPGYHGIEVKCGQEEYVLSDPQVRFVAAPEKKTTKSTKGTKKGRKKK
jgi:ParB/RepB/Spo0J family partition protein